MRAMTLSTGCEQCRRITPLSRRRSLVRAAIFGTQATPHLPRCVHARRMLNPRKLKLSPFARSIAALFSVVLAVTAANYYEELKVTRLNDDIAYRYFDTISRILVPDGSGGLTIGGDDTRKGFYFRNMDTLLDDITQVRREFCTQYVHVYSGAQENCGDEGQPCSEREQALSNARLICDANASRWQSQDGAR